MERLYGSTSLPRWDMVFFKWFMTYENGELQRMIFWTCAMADGREYKSVGSEENGGK